MVKHGSENGSVLGIVRGGIAPSVCSATIPSTNSLFRSHPKGAHRTVTLLRNKYVVPLNGRGVVKSVSGFFADRVRFSDNQLNLPHPPGPGLIDVMIRIPMFHLAKCVPG